MHKKNDCAIVPFNCLTRFLARFLPLRYHDIYHAFIGFLLYTFFAACRLRALIPPASSRHHLSRGFLHLSTRRFTPSFAFFAVSLFSFSPSSSFFIIIFCPPGGGVMFPTNNRHNVTNTNQQGRAEWGKCGGLSMQHVTSRRSPLGVGARHRGKEWARPGSGHRAAEQYHRLPIGSMIDMRAPLLWRCHWLRRRLRRRHYAEIRHYQRFHFSEER